MNNLIAVILAGGSGSRLWPLSRLHLPKQFLSLEGQSSMLDATIERLAPIVEKENVMVVTSEASAKGEAFASLQNYHTLLEPCGRNTAPAIAVAALKYILDGFDPIMLVLPADHVIRDVAAFHACLKTAMAAAAQGKLVTFGITPDKPETGFGYVQVGANISAELFSVAQFKEKPDLATATQFLAEGGYYWNSGMFVWRASVVLEAINRTLPSLGKMLEAIRTEVTNGQTFAQAVKAHFADAPNISIDHGVLEKSGNLYLVPANIGWSDVGSWDAVYEIADKDKDGNATRGNVLAIDCKNTLVRSEKRLVAAIGVEDLSIIETPDAILISKHGEAQKVRQIVDALAARGSAEHREHLTVKRPWGTYTVLEEGPGFKIKRIEVRPGGRLSLQSHQFRSEHWVVVSGAATVTCDHEVMTLHQNESTFIPIGAKHRLENLASEPVQMIEVQVGSSVDESDITRYDDQYGRTG